MTKFLYAFLILFKAQATCVHEITLRGKEIKSHPQRFNFYIENHNAQFLPYQEVERKLKDHKKYHIQYEGINRSKESYQAYNDRYIKYYTYQRLQNYLDSKKEKLSAIDYETSIIGKSIKGLNLYHIAPRNINKNKKLILMFGRHHGDEGTANWIIEGFLNHFISNKEFRDEYQLVLYPMVNPDGAQKNSRYNANGRDLNRVWHQDFSRSKDEVRIIQTHYLSNYKKPVIMLDMHGSYTEDFIFRVDKRFKGRDFYHLQQRFIDNLSSFDPYQNGNFQTSNGHRNMARIYFINKYQINALTHETPRSIRKSSHRSIRSLMSQGVALIDALKIQQ